MKKFLKMNFSLSRLLIQTFSVLVFFAGQQRALVYALLCLTFEKFQDIPLSPAPVTACPFLFRSPRKSSSTLATLTYHVTAAILLSAAMFVCYHSDLWVIYFISDYVLLGLELKRQKKVESRFAWHDKSYPLFHPYPAIYDTENVWNWNYSGNSIFTINTVSKHIYEHDIGYFNPYKR